MLENNSCGIDVNLLKSMVPAAGSNLHGQKASRFYGSQVVGRGLPAAAQVASWRVLHLIRQQGLGAQP
jgi:hypothetical protein